MADNTSIPIIVQGNSFSLAIPLQIYYINGDQMDLQDYTPDPTDEVSIQLKGSRRNYTYTPTIDGNVANINLGGYELADNYAVVVSIVKANGQRLRSFRSDQFFIVESSDDLTQDDIIAGLEENVIYLNAQAFIAGADGRGITSIVKTSTSGLVDTYTITYTDNTSSTFQVTNGSKGDDGASIATIEKTSTSGLVDTYTITLTNGDTSTFEVTNGMNGVDLGLANIVNDLATGGATNVLSAEQGKVLGDEIFENETIQLDIDSVALTDIYINTSTNKWAKSTGAKYQGKFLDISAYKGKLLKIGNFAYPLSGNYFYRFALLKNNSHTSGQAVNYSDTSPYNATISVSGSSDPSAQWYTLTIPDDVNYIYVYCYNADNVAPNPAYMPPEIYITIGTISRVDALVEDVDGLPSIKDVWFEKRNGTYLYEAPAADCWRQQTIGADGTIYNGSTNAPNTICFPRSASRTSFAKKSDFYDVAELPSATLNIKTADMGEGYYIAINVAQYTESLVFIKRLTNILYATPDNGWSASVELESNCRYFKIFGNLSQGTAGQGTAVSPASFVQPSGFVGFYKATITQESVPNRIAELEPTPFAKVRVCSWNIGHFALGTSYQTTITADNEAEMQTKWRTALNNLDADILLMCEYSTIFAKNPDVLAKNAVFNCYKYGIEGTTPSATSYMRTATYGNIEPLNTFEDVFPNTSQAGRYYQCSDMYIGGALTKVVITHLDFGSTGASATNRTDQIARLIEDFKAYDHVIIAGDFNVSNSSEYDAFVTAGFNIVNHGYMGDIATYPAGAVLTALDNIIVKGFAISNIGKFDDSTLSDHDALFCELTMI